jgi:hypothetical protein
LINEFAGGLSEDAKTSTEDTAAIGNSDAVDQFVGLRNVH